MPSIDKPFLKLLVSTVAALGARLEIRDDRGRVIEALPGHEHTINLQPGARISLEVVPVGAQVQADPTAKLALPGIPDAEPDQAAADAPQEDPTPARRRNRDRQAD